MRTKKLFCFKTRSKAVVLLGISLGSLCSLGSPNSWAQTPPGNNVSLERQIDDAFRLLFQNPADLASTNTYVDLLIRAGNYEGAIAALERLLVIPDAPPNLRITIANLYAQLRSYTMAEAMLTEALAEPDLPADDKARAESLLAQVRSASAPSRFSGAVIFGLRRQSNATFRTAAPQIFSNGVLVNNTLRPRSDTDTSIGLRLQHEYDLGLQQPAVLSTSGGLFVVQSRAARGQPIVAGFSTPYNLRVADINSGIVFNPRSDTPNLNVRPFLSGSVVQAQGASYLNTVGYGLDVNYRIGETGGVFATVESQRRNFSTRADVPNASQLNGRVNSFRVRWLHPVTPKQMLTAEMTVRKTNAGRGDFSSDSIEPYVSYAMSYPGWFGAGDWTTTPFVGVVRRQYRGADAAISTTARRDNEWRVGVSHAIPLTARWLGVLTLEQVRNRANLPNFDYKNNSITANLIFTF